MVQQTLLQIWPFLYIYARIRARLVLLPGKFVFHVSGARWKSEKLGCALENHKYLENGDTLRILSGDIFCRKAKVLFGDENAPSTSGVRAPVKG